MSGPGTELMDALESVLGGDTRSSLDCAGEVVLELEASGLLGTCTRLRDDPVFRFEQLIDLCAVDYLAYGQDEWVSDDSTRTGFSRGVAQSKDAASPGAGEREGPRFVVVYHLLSVTHNRRLRIRCACEDDDLPILPTVTDIWPSANWFEREAFDLFGVLFDGHPDLRRILTDYGFIGHPFRKDFPLIGNVEVRYDPERRRVIYQPVSIEPRTLVPKVIRDDHRYDGGRGDA